MNLIAQSFRIIEKLGEEKAFEEIKRAGFDGVDYSFFDFGTEMEFVLDGDYRQRAQLTKKRLQDCGLICNQAHAPFNANEDTLNMSDEYFQNIVRSIEYAGIIGAKHIVVHGLTIPNAADSEEMLEHNYTYYKKLEPYAEKFGVKIAIENLRYRFSTPYVMNEMLRRLNSPHFAVCIDVGHAQLSMGCPEGYLEQVTPGMVQALHIHDNNGGNDDHLIPGIGILHWDKIMQTLAHINYPGDFTFETGPFEKRFAADVIPSMLAFEVSIGRNLIKKLKEACAQK